MSWYRITAAENIPEREGRAVRLGLHEIALINLGERFVAVENRCPHKGGPLADGIVGGSVVTCPLHNWRVCLESGEVLKPSGQHGACVRTFGVKVEDGIVAVNLPEEDAEQAA
jgi:nitrite reductase (NADH) small subunit